MEKYQPLVFRTCLGFVHYKDDADDLTQEVFIQAYQSLSAFKGESAFSTWLYRIAINASLNRIRHSKKKSILQYFRNISGVEKDPEEIFLYEAPENPEEILIRKEHSDWLGKALDSLPESQRKAIVLSKYDDLPQKEIAEIMNISEGAVEALIQRAKKNLREKLSSDSKKMINSVGKK
ncbi:MAG: RNA polymerase sigma factor [Bacteroidales bacterium]|nr:RNA polymerase sigma factor [Bacteroidales bacterium]